MKPMSTRQGEEPIRIRRLVPALDTTDLDQATRLVGQVAEMEFIYGFKLGFALGLTHGLPAVVSAFRAITEKPLIYDHQKAGTDIPDTGALFAATLAEAGVDEAILFPQAGPRTLEAWMQALDERGVEVIVGGLMTHPGYLASEGGYLRDDAIPDMVRRAFELGARRFVLPLTRPEAAMQLIEAAGLDRDCAFYSPGFGHQGGQTSPFDSLTRHYLIVGRSLIQAADPIGYVTSVQRRLEEQP